LPYVSEYGNCDFLTFRDLLIIIRCCIWHVIVIYPLVVSSLSRYGEILPIILNVKSVVNVVKKIHKCYTKRPLQTEKHNSRKIRYVDQSHDDKSE